MKKINFEPRLTYIDTEILYGPEPSRANSSTANIIWKIAGIFIIPIVLLIGLIMYFKKSKSSKKVKILVTIIVIAVTVLLYFVVNEFIFKYE